MAEIKSFPPDAEFEPGDIASLNLTVSAKGFKVLREAEVNELDPQKEAKDSFIMLTTNITDGTKGQLREAFLYRKDGKLVLSEKKPE